MSMRCGANAMTVASTADSAMTTIDVVPCETSPNTSTEIPRIGMDASSRTNMTRAMAHRLGRLFTERGMRSAMTFGSGFTATSMTRWRTVFALSKPLAARGIGDTRWSTGRIRTVWSVASMSGSWFVSVLDEGRHSWSRSGRRT